MTNSPHIDPQSPHPMAPQPMAYAPPPAPPKKGAAVTALVLGIIAILTAAVPVLGAVLGVVAIIFAAVALKKRQPRGFSVTGLILGILATIGSIIVTVTLVLTLGGLLSALDGEWTVDTDGTVTSPIDTSDGGAGDVVAGSPEPDAGEAEADVPAAPRFERVEWAGYDVATAPASTHAGTEEDPHPLGTRFPVEDKWEVVVNAVDLDAYEHLLALDPDTPAAPEGRRYVLVNLSLLGLVEGPAEVRTLRVYLDVPGALISSRRSGATSPEPQVFREGMQITGTYTGYIAYQTVDAPTSVLRFAETLTTSHIFVAVE